MILIDYNFKTGETTLIKLKETHTNWIDVSLVASFVIKNKIELKQLLDLIDEIKVYDPYAIYFYEGDTTSYMTIAEYKQLLSSKPNPFVFRSSNNDLLTMLPSQLFNGGNYKVLEMISS